MGEFSFPKHFHLRRAEDFRTTYADGVKGYTRSFIVFRRRNGMDHPRLGLSIGRKYGNAVRRNRVKRLVREAVRLNWRSWKLEGSDIIVIAKRGRDEVGFADVTKDFKKHFSRFQEER